MFMAMDGRVRKVHRRSWSAFFSYLIPASIWQGWAQLYPSKHDGRTVWTAKYVLLSLGFMGWSGQTSLHERFREAFEALVAWFPKRHRPGTTFPGWRKAIVRFGVPMLQAFWGCVRHSFSTRLADTWFWHGWAVFAVDGSRVDTARTEANEAELGRAGRDKTHPQWWMTWLVHLPTLLLWDWRQGPGTSSERSHLLEMLDGLVAAALIVADAGFTGFEFLSRITESGRYFLVRCGSNVTLLLEGKLRRIDDLHDRRGVYLWPSEHGDRPPLPVRIIVLKRGGKRIYLLTNVLDSTRLSRQMASDFYAARWDIEVNYRGFKQTMQRTKVQSKTPQTGAVELAGNILATGLMRLHAAILLGARRTQFSVAGALRAIRRMLEALRYRRPTAPGLQMLSEALRDNYRRRSSKRARDWPHKKRETPAGAPRTRRLRTAEIIEIHTALAAAKAKNC